MYIHLSLSGIFGVDKAKNELLKKQSENVCITYLEKTASGKQVRVMYTPLKDTFIKKNWGMPGLPIFLIFAEAVLTCTHNLCFEQK